MGIIKHTKDKDGHGWEEPSVRDSLIAIYKASCTFLFILTALSFLFATGLFGEHPCSEAKLVVE
jgi:hypothetical protein